MQCTWTSIYWQVMNTENNCIVQILIISYSQTLLFSLPKKWDYASLYICSSSIFKKTGFANSTRVVRLLMYFAMAMITLKWNGWQLLNFHKHIIYCLENAFSKITFKRYRLFSGILMINTRKHNKINACNKPDFTTFEWQTRI